MLNLKNNIFINLKLKHKFKRPKSVPYHEQKEKVGKKIALSY